MKTTLTLLVFVSCVLAAFAAGKIRHDAIHVSIITLIGSPDIHAGKLVRVSGFLNIAFEHNVIYLHQEDRANGLSKNGLWLEASRAMMQELQKLSGRYVLLEGVFDPKNPGHGALFSGAIVDVNRADLWRAR